MDNSAENNGNRPYDLTVINALCYNNPQFLEKLLLVFTENVIIDVAAIKTAASEGNWSEAAKVAHKIKPSISHFGIYSLKDVIRGLENYENSNRQQLNLQVTELDAVINDVLLNLTQEFPEIFNKQG